VNTELFTKEKRWLIPSFNYIRELKKERKDRSTNGDLLKARDLAFRTQSVSLGCSPLHYKFFCLWQLNLLYARNCSIIYKGLENIPQGCPSIFVMKHRGFADITLHGFGYAWATSGLPYDNNPFKSNDAMREVIDKGKSTRFLMKEDLLSLPIGHHLVLNGGIPILQDHETKALNNPGYDVNAEKVQKKIKEMSTWFSFKNSYREILNLLKANESIMIYGEATRVPGNKMGHLSTKFLNRLSKVKNTSFIPVGSTWNKNEKTIAYGKACQIDELRDSIASLSNLTKNDYI
jgi:1-acyl-sn-glycerol-3-phosphate acyltransferase